jgi:hypothetical protein
MSNKRSKQSKNAQRKQSIQERSISARSEARKIEAYLMWEGLSPEDRHKLAKGGIMNLETYQVVLSGVRPPKGKTFIDWVGESGLGIVDTVRDFMGILAVRTAEQMLADFNARVSGGTPSNLEDDRASLGGRKIQNAYRTLSLPDGRAYLASPYNFDTPEGRIWLDGAIRSPGIAAGQQVTYHLAA